jgi:hypothetical protein
MITHIPDELLTAYVNGELDEAGRARVEQAISQDARLAQRVAQQRATKGRLRNVFEGTLREPAPRRTVNGSRPEGPAGPAQIIDLARVRAARARRPERRRLSIPRRATTAIAASLLAGVGAGLLIQRLLASAVPVEYRDGALIASGLLNRSLNEQVAGVMPTSTAVRVGQSFHAKAGGYCRTFTLENGHTATGLACREQQHWHILTLLSNDVAASAGNAQLFRLSSSTLPAPLLTVINERTTGEALDAAGESKARRSDWR